MIVVASLGISWLFSPSFDDLFRELTALQDGDAAQAERLAIRPRGALIGVERIVVLSAGSMTQAP